MHFRWKLFGLVAVVAAAAVTLLMAAGGASAQPTIGDSTALDPQTANVPYVAWAGEEIRFAKCYSSDDLGEGVDGGQLQAHFSVVNPLIDTPSSVQPVFEGGFNGTGNVVIRGDGMICAEGSFESQSPGLADILLNVTDRNGINVLPKHDFIGIWLRMNAPTLTELPGGGDNGTGAFNLGSNNGAPVAPGIVGVTVTGSFPFAGQTWNFPGTTDWPTLAGMLATDSSSINTSPGDAAYRWDIHDNNGLDEGHPLIPACSVPPAGENAADLGAALDAVDNCNGGTDYSRIGYDDTGTPVGLLGGSDVGPYDPLFSDTLLGNGVLDSGDVPMPAAQIDLTLTGGTGMAGPTGALESASKQVLFSRDGTGADSAHNLYAPYYSQWIPATSRGPISSGVDGPAPGNDFSGFQTNGLYVNWDILNGVGGSGSNACLAADGSAIPNAASGDDQFLSGTVYTDEHGMAEVLYDPNAGFTLTPDANNRCASFLLAPSTFTTNIQATAVYPFKKVAPAQASNVLTKTVTTASLKTLVCIPKGVNEAFCVETVRDDHGNPVPDVHVSFTANSMANANIQADSIVLGGFDTTGQGIQGGDFAQRIVQVSTNDLGEAGVLITDSIAADCVNVRAENLDTSVGGNPGVSVFTDFDPATGAVCNAGPQTPQPPITPPNTGGGGGTPPPPPPPPPHGGGGAAPIPTVTPQNTGATAGAGALNGGKPAVISATSKQAKASKKTHLVKASISIARFVTIGHSRYLTVRLLSTAKTAKVRITLVGANGKVIGHKVATIRTNHLVKVMKLGKSVHSVRISVPKIRV